MKLGLVTTTIHVPEVLRYLRTMPPVYGIRGPNNLPTFPVHFFIAGDTKSPHHEISQLCEKVGNAVYITPAEQQRWKCSEAIGWNCIQRRNIATLEALRWGATHIYSWDTDNIPMSRDHFSLIAQGFETFHGPMLQTQSPQSGWIDTGNLLEPPARQRGIPDVDTPWSVSHIIDARIGVVVGACLGDPDISAVDRIATHPEVHNVHELARTGVVIDPFATTVFNSQNSSFVRELAPAMFMIPNVGRFDDLFASIICRRVMREHDYHLRFGKPFTWQSRNEHNLLTDLKAEIYGMEHIQNFVSLVERLTLLDKGSPLEQVRYIAQQLRDFYPTLYPFGAAMWDWCDDVEAAMLELPL